MKRKDDSHPSGPSTRVKTKLLDHTLKPSELPTRDKKRNLSLVEPVLRDPILKKTKTTLSAGLRPEKSAKGNSLRRATSQAARLKQVKAWLSDASAIELDTLKNYLLKKRPEPTVQQNSSFAGCVSDQLDGAPLTVQSGISAHVKPKREKEKKEAGEDILDLLLQENTRPSTIHVTDPGLDRQQVTASLETPTFLERPREERPRSESLHGRLMSLARRRRGLV